MTDNANVVRLSSDERLVFVADEKFGLKMINIEFKSLWSVSSPALLKLERQLDS